MLGVLRDLKGLECWDCDGTCTVGDEDCGTCEGTGLIPGFRALDLEDGDHGDLEDTVRLVWQSRERPLTPGEWLALPALYASAYRYLSQYFRPFDERLQCLAQESK